MKFKRLTVIAQKMTEEIKKFNQSELEKLIRECRSTSTTNCGWQLHRMRDIVIELATSRIEWLQLQKNCKEGMRYKTNLKFEI